MTEASISEGLWALCLFGSAITAALIFLAATHKD